MLRASHPEQTNINRFLFPVLAIYSIGIPLHFYITNLAAMALGVLSIWRISTKPGSIKQLYTPWTLLNLTFYALHILALVFITEHTSEGLFDLEVKLSILALPLFISLFRDTIIAYCAMLLRIFAWSSSIVIAAILGHGIILFNNGIPYESILYTGMTAPLGVHHAYLSMYGLSSIVIFLYLESNSKTERTLKFIASIVILLFIYLTLSKIHILAAMLVLPLGIYSQIKTSSRSKTPYLYAMLSVVALIGFSYVYSPVKLKMTEAFAALTGKSEKQYENTNNRITKWESAFAVFLESRLIGVGPGDVQTHLNKVYEHRQFTEGLHHQYNAHNQFLQSMAGLGLTGLASMLSLLFYLYYQFQKGVDRLPFLILTIYAFTNLTESLLCVNAGVVFHSFILTLLIYFPPVKSI